MRDAHPIPGRDVVVAGRRLHVVTHGRGGGPPLLLVAGAGGSAYLWRDVMRDLEREVPTIAPDLVGQGRSERPRVEGYDLLAQARRLVGLLDLLGVERVLAAGHGLGGAVAVHLASLAPARVAGLALLGAALHPEAQPRRLATLELPPGPVRDRYLAPLRERSGRAALRRLVRSTDLAPTAAAWEVLRREPPPALLLWGTADAVQPASYGQRLAAELPGATWLPLTGAGHLLPEECPERVAEELAGFRAELPMLV